MSNNKKRGEEGLAHLERELKSRERKEKARPLGVVAASLVVILALVGGIWFMATRDTSDEEMTASEETAAEETQPEVPEAEPLSLARAEALPETVECTYTEDGQDAHGATVPNGKDVSTEGTVTVDFETNQGPIGLELDRAAAPCAVNAISHLADEGYYDDSVCHRMTSGGLNVLQCGDPTGTGSGGPGFGFDTEYPYDEMNTDGNAGPVIYPKGTVAMARAQDPSSNGSQFFLNYDDSTLAPDYTYFGKINDQGMETLAKIAEAGVEGGAPDGAPAEEVKIESATVES